MRCGRESVARRVVKFCSLFSLLPGFPKLASDVFVPLGRSDQIRSSSRPVLSISFSFSSLSPRRTQLVNRHARVFSNNPSTNIISLITAAAESSHFIELLLPIFRVALPCPFSPGSPDTTSCPPVEITRLSSSPWTRFLRSFRSPPVGPEISPTDRPVFRPARHRHRRRNLVVVESLDVYTKFSSLNIGRHPINARKKYPTS